MSHDQLFTYICKRCGKEFQSSSYHVLYCRECRIKNRADVAHNYYKKNKTPSQQYDRVCPICGKEFTTTRSKQLYDRVECYQRAYFLKNSKKGRDVTQQTEIKLGSTASDILRKSKEKANLNTDEEMIMLALKEFMENHPENQ